MSSIKLIFLFKKRRLVLIEEGLELAKSNDMLFTETSAKTGSNINVYYFVFYFEKETFYITAFNILEKI